MDIIGPATENDMLLASVETERNSSRWRKAIEGIIGAHQPISRRRRARDALQMRGYPDCMLFFGLPLMKDVKGHLRRNRAGVRH